MRVARRIALLFCAAGLVACAEGQIGDGGPGLASFDDGAPADGGVQGPPPPPPPVPGCDSATAAPLLARALKIDEVTVNQGVSVRIASDGLAVTDRAAPVVVGRAGVLRVFVEPVEEWQAREVVARLSLDGETREVRELVAERSAAERLDSTLNFDLGPSDLSESSAVAVELLEVDPCLDYPGASEQARFPDSGAEPLGAKSAPGAFRLVLVPTRYQADGSDRTPDTGAETVSRFQDTMAAMFPLTDFEVSVREAPLDFGRELEPSGAGWTSLLNDCLTLRADDDADPNSYYYCAVRPSDEPVEYCGRSCVAGIGPVPSPTDPFNRGATGLLYENGVSTFVHELGHTLGLPHAPCGLSNADPDFPYEDAAIGVVGYETASRTLVPADYRDVMSYCSPVWISDYNYDKLYDRLVTVTAQNLLAVRKQGLVALRPIVIEVDGELTVEDTVLVDAPPEGETVDARWLDASGTGYSVPGTFVKITHLPGGIVYVPELIVAPAAIEIAGLGTAPIP